MTFCKAMKENPSMELIDKDRKCFLSYIMDSMEHGGYCKYNDDCDFRKEENLKLDNENKELINRLNKIEIKKLTKLIRENKLGENDLKTIREMISFLSCLNIV